MNLVVIFLLVHGRRRGSKEGRGDRPDQSIRSAAVGSRGPVDQILFELPDRNRKGDIGSVEGTGLSDECPDPETLPKLTDDERAQVRRATGSS